MIKRTMASPYDWKVIFFKKEMEERGRWDFNE